MKIEPYLFFNGRCDEAIGFYQAALGAKVEMILRFKDAPQGPGDQPTSKPELAEKVMHADLTIDGHHLLVSDGMGVGEPTFDGFSLTITVADDAAARDLFAALGEGGRVHQPLMKTFFASSFGMLADKFGLGWIVLTPQP